MDQKQIGKAAVYVVKATMVISDSGAGDSVEIINMLTDALDKITNNLTDNNQGNFAEWLLKETAEFRKERGMAL